MADAFASAARRLGGALLIVLAVVPVWKVLERQSSGLAGADTVNYASYMADLMWSGTVMALIPLVLLLWLGDRVNLMRPLRAVAARIASIPARVFAAIVGLAGAAVALAFSWHVLELRPNLIDSLAQLVHARYLAAGMAAGPTELAEFSVIANTLVTDAGWVSQYPPGHPLIMALAMRAGAVWAAGPICLGITLFFTALIAERTLPHRIVAARVLLLLAAASPFLVSHAGAYMNHTPAAALTAAAVWCVLRGRDGSARWALAAGAVASFALAVRPLSALAMIVAVALVAWSDRAGADRLRFLGARVALASAAALPLTLLHLLYNRHFFGGPLTFGYLAAYGPSHRPGFGVDPWGNAYGLREAIGYTSSDLTALNVALFEVPLPLVAGAGLFLVLARRLERGERVVVAWALSAVVANFFYWHHGVFMGPRMLNEAAPAWVLLVALALHGLLDMLPRDAAPDAAARARLFRGPLRPAVLGTLVLVAAFSLGFMIPQRLLSYGGDWYRSFRAAAPSPAAPALVFVHGPWMGRVGSRLMADGMRLDSIETTLRQNTTCAGDHYANARDAGDPAAAPSLDLDPASERLLPRMDIPRDNFIRVRDGEQMDSLCIAELRSDLHGVVELAPFLWLGALPGMHGGVRYVRDLGPERNRRLLEREPARRPWVFASQHPDSTPRLMPYADGMRMLWGRTSVLDQVSR